MVVPGSMLATLSIICTARLYIVPSVVRRHCCPPHTTAAYSVYMLGRTGIWVLGCVLACMVLRCVLARIVLGCVLARIQFRGRTLDGIHVECQDVALE